jgi:predicted phosphodiesterase
MRKALIVAVVAVATLAGAIGGLATFRLERQLDVGAVRLSVDPGHRGALDLYVPLVDWGVRLPVVRLPARVNVDVRSIDRDAVLRLADSGRLTAGVALVVLLPPRCNVDSPRYYANGPEVPAALRALESLGASEKTLDEEIDQQLVGIARFVSALAGRPALEQHPRLTVASNLHNNVIALPALENAARGGPLLFAGDLTDRGSPLEQKLVLRVLRAGSPLVFISGNHDSDVLERKLARAGAIVLTRSGRLRIDGTTDGQIVQRVGSLRITGYDDPLKRLAREDYRDRGATPTPEQQEEFAAWLEALGDQIDVAMIHAPALAQLAVRQLRERPPAQPLILVVGHTHKLELARTSRLTVLNAGSVGGGGTGNLDEGTGKIGLARMTYDRGPKFAALAVDLIQIEPGSGEAQAQRVRLDEPDATVR